MFGFNQSHVTVLFIVLCTKCFGMANQTAVQSDYAPNSSHSRQVMFHRLDSLNSFLKQFPSMLQLPSGSIAFSAPETRQIICEHRLQELLHNETFYQKTLSITQNFIRNEVNRTSLSARLCELEAQTSSQDYFFALWANSTERFIGKTLLENTVNPILQSVVLVSLVGLACPIFYQLAYSRLHVGLWHFLYIYSLVGCLRALLVYFPNVILRLVALVYNRPKIIQYSKLDNLGLFVCPAVNFVDQVLVNMPNSLVPIILWDQLLRSRNVSQNGDWSTASVHMPLTAAGDSTGECISNRRNTKSSRIQREKHTSSTQVSTQNTLIRDGLTTFGAKLVTITVFVVHAFVQVHTLWLYTFVEGKCNFDWQKHSTVFSFGYPYFLRVTLCVIPDLLCLAGLIHVAWVRICKKSSRETKPSGEDSTSNSTAIAAPVPTNRTTKPNLLITTSDPDSSENPNELQLPEETKAWDGAVEQSNGKTVFVHKCRSCIVRIQLGKQSDVRGQLEDTYPNHVHGQTKPLWTENGAVQTEDDRADKPQLTINSPRADLNMAITLACCFLTFTMPQDIEWICLHKMRYNGDNNFVKNYQVLKFSELVKHLLECWFLLGWVLFMPFMFLTNPLVRAQFFKLYCHCVRCKRRNCRFCYCGYYCDSGDRF